MDRTPNKKLVEEAENAENPVTRGSLKQVCVNRLKETDQSLDQAREFLEQCNGQLDGDLKMKINAFLQDCQRRYDE